VKFKGSDYKFKKLFMESPNGWDNMKGLYKCISLKKSEKLMNGINLIETVCDNSHKLGEIRATATHINAGGLKWNKYKMFMNGNAGRKSKTKIDDSKIIWWKKIRSTKLMQDPTIRSGTWLGSFGLIKLKCDSSYKLGEIRTTQTHFIADDSFRKRKVQMIRKWMLWKKL
jgi:hypothetical protein